MTMDTPSGESNASLSVRDAAALFNSPEPEQRQEPEAKATEPAKVETPQETPEATQTETDRTTEPDEGTPQVELVEVDIDGYKVQVPKDKAEKLEKDRLRQADYTRKTMAASEERKAAAEEANKAREERQKAAQALHQAQTVLMSQLNEQSQTNWHQLREENPTEFLKEWHLFTERQARLQEIQGRTHQLASIERAEAKKALLSRLAEEHQAALDKLPEWKDEKRADAERKSIAKELLDRGFDHKQVFGERESDGSPSLENPGLTDHRLLLLARDAMLYRQMMEKARAASKKVENLPRKVEQPGGGESNALDGRTKAMRDLDKSGSLRDAARVFALLK